MIEFRERKPWNRFVQISNALGGDWKSKFLAGILLPPKHEIDKKRIEKKYLEIPMK